MRIIEAVASLELGGIERLVTEIAPRFVLDHGCPTAIVCLISSEGPLRRKTEKDGIPVLNACRDSRIPLAWMRNLEQRLREWKADVYHTHHTSGLPWQIIAAKRAGVKRIVISEHNTSPLGIVGRLRHLVYDRFIWPHIDTYTCVSQSVLYNLAAIRRRSLDQYQVVPNRVDTRRFKPDESLRQTVRHALNLGPETFLIGSVGSLTHQKGFEYLIDAASIVCNQIQGVQFRIFGEGPGRAHLQRRIDDAELTDTIILSGNVDPIETYLPSLDLFVLPSLWEGMSLAVMEAMSAQLPVVSTAVSGTIDLLDNGSGIVVPPADSDALAKEIVRMYKDKELRRRLSQSARQKVVENYSLDMTIIEYIRIFNDQRDAKI